MNKPLYQEIAALLEARRNCSNANPTNSEWMARHTERAEALVAEHLPSGSGFDNGTRLDVDASTPDCIVLHTSFHHMDSESGSYDGWTEHTVRVRASLAHGFTLTISGHDRNEIKDYISDSFQHALHTNVGE